MRLVITSPIVDYKGNPVKDGGEEITALSAVFLALNNFAPGENPTPEEKLRIYRLSNAAEAAFRSEDGILELSLEDASFIKEKSGLHNMPLLHGRLVDLLEPPAPPPAPADEAPAEQNGEGVLDPTSLAADPT